MALRIHCFNPIALPLPKKILSFSFPITTLLTTTRRPITQILCTNNNITDADLASDLATEVAKINTQLVQKEEAMKKSKELLFTELCNYLSVETEEMKRKWIKMDQEEKLVLVKGFVSEWSVNFHPLSARSVKELIEEYLQEKKPSSSGSSTVLFPGLRKIMGISQNK